MWREVESGKRTKPYTTCRKTGKEEERQIDWSGRGPSSGEYAGKFMEYISTVKLIANFDKIETLIDTMRLGKPITIMIKLLYTNEIDYFGAKT